MAGSTPRLKIGGLMRCCIQAWDELCNLGTPPDVIECAHCPSIIVRTTPMTWEWGGRRKEHVGPDTGAKDGGDG